ncbi:protein artichoke-like [Palaemon carinicauda]|uniref:protein artichoke-like n=1 Tax=Palaemon carinicauda TaxID=392227 RepID=UPI0035B6563D
MDGYTMKALILSLAASLNLLVSADTSVSDCPSWEENPMCPCYNNGDGIYMECPMVSLSTVGNVLGLVQEPLKSLSIYDLEMEVTTLPSGIFKHSAGVMSLQISHSNVMSIADNSFHGLEKSLESLTIKHCKLSDIPETAIRKLAHLVDLDLQMNNITELTSFGFAKMIIKTLNFQGNMINLVSDFAFDGLEETLEDLNLMNNDLKTLPVNALKKMKSLKKLKVAWNHITDFTTQDSRLEALEYLDLSSNNIRKVRSNSLSGMPNLTSLSLYMNSISTITKDSFRESTNLETLFLGNNNIRELDPKLFKHTQKISVIDLGNNNIQSINDGVFSNLPKLQELVLSNNNIRELMHETFLNSPAIRILNLEHNAIRLIEPNTFNGMPYLETLLLSHNNIQEIYPRIFASNINLKVLKLDHNGIKDLSEITFKNTTSLEKLVIHKNKIRTVSPGLFSRLLDLKELHLHDNEIRVIPTGAFSNLHKLQFVSLQGNQILTLLDTLNHNSKSLYSLNLSGNEITAISPKAFEGQSLVNTLRLDHNNISSINNEIFNDLTKLSQLHLQNNHINHIDDEALSSLSSLQKLFISNNYLVKISVKTFQGLSGLRELHLQNNAIEDIAPNAFQWMTELQKLDLSGNVLPIIKKEYFNTELSVRELYIENAEITKIEDGALEALVYLEILSLRGNKLLSLDSGSLRLTQLSKLDLSGNKFQTLDSNSLMALPNLEDLNLSDCNIENIPDNLFDDSISLKTLNLAKNRIKHFGTATFASLSDLVNLDISENFLQVDSCRAFLATSKLQHLSISGNPFINLCPVLGELKSLKKLEASNIGMAYVSKETLVQLGHLKHLDISDNLIVDIPVGSFLKSSLQRLNVGSNFLTQLPDAIFMDKMEKLKILNVTGNPLQRITGPEVNKNMILESLERLEAAQTNLTVITSLEFSHLPNLRSLNLEGGAINKVSPGAFRSLAHLTQLNLGYNLLEILPRERMRGLTSLTHLNLTRNKIKKLDQLPSDAHSLKVIDISSNMLTELDESTFKHTEGLEEVILRDNWITTLHPKALEPLVHLKVLDLSQNNVEVLQPAILSAVERTLETYRIDGNPVICGCETLEFWSWLQNHPTEVKHPNSIYCDLPERLRGQPFLQLSASAFCPQPLILRLAIQDIQSQSFLVTWQAANTSTVYGYKVTYQAMSQESESDEDLIENRLTVQSSPTIGLSSRSYLLEDLQPSTEYQICVHGLMKSIGLARSHTVAPASEEQKEEGARCTRGHTLSIPPAPATGTSGGRVGIILGIILAVALLLGIVIAVVWYRVCRTQSGRGQGSVKRANGAPPDYYSHYQGHHPHQQDDDEFAC